LLTLADDKRMKAVSVDEKAALQGYMDGLPTTVSKGSTGGSGPLPETVERTVPQTVPKTVSETVVQTVEATVSKGSTPNLTLPNLSEPSQTEPSVSKDTGASAGGIGNDPGRPAWWPQRDRWGRVPGDVTEKLVFDVGKVVLGKSAGGQLTRLRKTYRGDPEAWRNVLDLVMQASEKSSPSEWFARVVKNAEVDEFPVTTHEKYPEFAYGDADAAHR